ncbi:Scr1 family TA system antitoxin-like transcriptional regulator [Nocardia testacea]|uniref:Scr1 family TA system antitoxin-like transcriptional regulator n=1 Tax=Nocardia testacea TaxID=248551 RepID=A0ABW7VZJ9_9NOCA
MDSDEDWGRFAEYAVARRQELGMATRHALAQATGLSYRLLGDLERGVRRGVSDGTLAIVEQALAWLPGSAREILRGGEPAPFDYAPEPSSTPSSWMRSLAEAYRIAADLAESGQLGMSARLMRALTDISQTAVMHSVPLDDASAEAIKPEPEVLGQHDRAQPTVIGIAFGRHLRHLRERKRFTQDRASNLLGWPTAHIWLLELGHMVLDKDELRRLLTLYGEDTPQIRECIRIASQAERSGWWNQHSSGILPSWFKAYLHLEQSASVIRTFESHFIPGLLQTADYAASVMAFPDRRDVDRKVLARMERQKILDLEDPPHLWVILDEAALVRAPVDADVLRGQISHLIEMTKRSNVAVQLLPLSMRLNAFSSSFCLLKFQEPEIPHIVYAEQLTSAIYIDRREDVYPYMALLDRLSTVALNPESSVERLTWILRTMNGSSAPFVTLAGSATWHGATT